MRRFSCIIFVMAAATVAFGSSAGLPLPYTDVGTNIAFAASVWAPSSYETAGGGGEFVGSINYNAASGTGIVTHLWCIDDQAYFNPWQNSITQTSQSTSPTTAQVGQANITLLDDVATASLSNQVQYGEVTNSRGPGGAWGNQSFYDGSTLGYIPSDATARFEMAAYLVSQHDGSFSTLSNANGAADAIQQAIWAIANNSLGPVGGGADIDPIVGNTLGGDTTNSYRVNQALQFYNDTNNSSSPAEVALLAQFTSQWAVISWGVNSTGTLLSYYLPLSSISSPGDENQTFLVQVDHPGETPFTYSRVFTPEPAFYGALAVGWQAFSSSLSECEFPEPRLEDNYVSELTSKHSSGFVICPSSTQRSAFLRYSHVGEV